jgi:hypothetical protein
MNDACNFADSGMLPKQPEELYEEYKRRKNNSVNKRVIRNVRDNS